MIEIEHKRDIDLPADTVWEEVRHFDRVLTWVPGGDESTITVKGEGVGAIRDIELVFLLTHRGHAHRDEGLHGGCDRDANR